MSDIDRAREAHRALQAVWILVSMRQQDAVANEVERLGKALSDAIDRMDAAACREAFQEAKSWVSISAGVIVSRLQAIFEA